MSDTTTIIQPATAITSDNHGGYILIATAIFLVSTILFSFIRISIRMGNVNFGSDDAITGIATCIGFVQSVVIMLAVTRAGLGKKINKMDSETLRRTELLWYIGEMLYLATTCAAKVATAELIARLSRQTKHLVACRLLSGFTILWGVASILAIGIGCHPSHAWDLVDRCPDLSTTWFSIGAVNFIIEAYLCLLPIWLIWDLMMPFSSKVIVGCAFGSRSPLIAIIVLRICSLAMIQHSTDYTFKVALLATLSQVEMHFSLISATIPCLRPFLKAFNTGSFSTYAAQMEKGMLAPAEEGINLRSSKRSSRRMSSTHRSSFPQRLSTASTSCSGALRSPENDKAPQLPPHLEAPEEHPNFDPFAVPAVTTVYHGDAGSLYDDDKDSRRIIRKTMGYGVRYSPELKR